MPDRDCESTEATAADLRAAEEIRSAVQGAAEVLRFVRDRLLLEARRHPRQTAATVDGRDAIVGPDALSATEWIADRVEGLCCSVGSLGEAVDALEAEAGRAPLEGLAEYVREARGEEGRRSGASLCRFQSS